MFASNRHYSFLTKTTQYVFIPCGSTHNKSTHHPVSNAECVNALWRPGLPQLSEVITNEAVVLASEFGHSIQFNIIIRG